MARAASHAARHAMRPACHARVLSPAQLLQLIRVVNAHADSQQLVDRIGRRARRLDERHRRRRRVLSVRERDAGAWQREHLRQPLPLQRMQRREEGQPGNGEQASARCLYTCTRE